MRQPVLPDAGTKAGVSRNLKLAASQSDLLWRGVDGILRDIARHSDSAKAMPDRKARKKALAAALKARDAFADIIRRDDPYLRGLIRQALPELGADLSGMGLSRLGNVGSIPLLLRDEDLSRYYSPARGDASTLYAKLENAAASIRSDIARDVGPPIAIAVLDLLSAPFAAQWRVENADKGGRPQELYRNYLVQELTRLYRDIYQQDATMTRDGAFVRFCSQIFGAVNMPEDGIERAVERVLTKMKADTGKRRPPKT